MEFITLHELSLRLDVSVRVLRSRMKQLLLAGKLTEPVDCRRDAFVDETHFTWLVRPDAFIRASGLRPVSRPANQPLPAASQPVSQPVNPVNQSGSRMATQPATQAARPEQPPPKPDPAATTLEREMITVLKDQIRVKDTQIADLSEQNKALNGLHLKLTGQIVQQADRIQTLLRLTGGKSDLADAATQTVNQSGNQTAAPVSQPSATGNQTADHAEPFGSQVPRADSPHGDALAA